jgi:hypothetical protein
LPDCSLSRVAALSPGRGLSAAGRLVVDRAGSAPVLVSRSLAKLVPDWLDLDGRTPAVV